jgi:hypothetical protein
VIVTLSRQFSAGARTIGRELSRRLQCRLLDEDIRSLVAARLGTSVEAVSALDERTDPLGTRLMQSFAASVVPEAGIWPGAAPDLTADDVEGATRAVIEELAAREPLVIVGRAGRWILGDRPDALHVRLVASFPVRVQRLVERESIERKRAEELVRETDRARAAHILHYYGADWNDPVKYHLILNTDALSVPIAADIIEQIARRVSPGAAPT